MKKWMVIGLFAVCSLPAYGQKKEEGEWRMLER